jgi:HEAT repeat protein
MVACGALEDAGLVPKYEALLFPKDSQAEDQAVTDSVAVAAVWGLARMNDGKAVPLLRRIAGNGTPPMRALAVLGLGMSRDKSSVAEIATVARTLAAGTVARAAAAYALGELGAESEAPTLLALAEGSDPLPRQMALLSLARMAQASGKEPAWQRSAVAAMADAIFAGTDADSDRARAAAEALERAAVAGLVMLSQPPSKGAPQRETLPVPEAGVEVEATLDALVPRDASEQDRAAALVKFAEPIQRAALTALQTSPERARAVLDALGTGEGQLEPLLGKDTARGAPAPTSQGAAVAAAHDKVREMLKALEPSIVPRARDPNPSVRTKAIVLLAGSSSDGAATAVIDGVEDATESVQRVALSAIGKQASARAVGAVGKLLATHDNWAMRVLAAQAMGRLGAAGAGADATKLLREAATKDKYALVREAALKALAAFDAAAARALAAQMAQGDAEPRVRETAKTIATGGSMVN